MRKIINDNNVLVKNISVASDMALARGVREMVLKAQREHRFISDSNMAERSVENERVAPNRQYIQINSDIAIYTTYLINGHGTWRPDPFVENAVNALLEPTRKLISNAIDKVVSKFNG